MRDRFCVERRISWAKECAGNQSFAPLGLFGVAIPFLRLAPWAAFFRRCAATRGHQIVPPHRLISSCHAHSTAALRSCFSGTAKKPCPSTPRSNKDPIESSLLRLYSMYPSYIMCVVVGRVRCDLCGTRYLAPSARSNISGATDQRRSGFDWSLPNPVRNLAGTLDA